MKCSIFSIVCIKCSLACPSSRSESLNTTTGSSETKVAYFWHRDLSLSVLGMWQMEAFSMQCVNFVFFGLDSDFIWRFCQDGLEISGFKVSDQTNGGSNAKAAFRSDKWRE